MVLTKMTWARFENQYLVEKDYGIGQHSTHSLLSGSVAHLSVTHMQGMGICKYLLGLFECKKKKNKKIIFL